MPLLYDSVLPPGAKILVTGVNGYIGSHVADQALEHGFTVRGSVRGIAKHQWMIEYFAQKYGQGRFELVEVPDMKKERAFDGALQGVSGVVHVASVVTLDPDPRRVIPIVVDSTLGILQSAAQEAGVKRFVLTSSATAAAHPKPNDTSIITSDSWNEEAVRLAQDLPDSLSDVEKGFAVYGASKVRGEQAVWKWVAEHRPAMVVNTVLPGGNFGTILSVQHQGYPSTAMMAHALQVSDQATIDAILKDYPPEWFVDVQDTARLHIAALTHPGAVQERLFAYAAPYNWNVVLAEFRALFPQQTFVDDIPGVYKDRTVIRQRGRAEALLRDMGRDRFTSLRESLAALAASG